MSDTAAVAADTASDAPTCGSLSDSGVFSLGNSTSTSPSQNAMRSRKNMSRPCVFILLRLISQSALFLNRVDKPQVSALNENRGKFVKKPNDSIRRKFSIDAPRAIAGIRSGVSTISKPYRFRFGNLAFTIRAECGAGLTQNRFLRAISGGPRGRLSVRLSSL